MLLAKQVAERSPATVRMVKEAVNAIAYARTEQLPLQMLTRVDFSAGFSDARRARSNFLSRK